MIRNCVRFKDLWHKNCGGWSTRNSFFKCERQQILGFQKKNTKTKESIAELVAKIIDVFVWNEPQTAKCENKSCVIDSD